MLDHRTECTNTGSPIACKAPGQTPRRTARFIASLVLYTATAIPALAAEGDKRQFTYAWPFVEGGSMAPRGGTTQGPDVTLSEAPAPAWEALHEPGIDKKERDRRAILAMAGPYRATFDFIETLGFTADYSPSRPYQSWATEYIYVLADEPDFISLQHVLVMQFQHPDGSVSEPAVMKHWRQDWRYQDRQLNVYRGDNTWAQEELAAQAVTGTWSQAVFQVDDSPRYESIGHWAHSDSFSSWESDTTWRPLPRREFSVRDDYQVLAGTNRHTITPSGWVQEEDNLKLVLSSPGEPRDAQPYLAREAGLNRYQRIEGFDFSAGDAYLERTGPFWAEVRRAWSRLLGEHPRVRLKATVDGERLFEVMFEYAESLGDQATFDREAARAFVRRTLATFTEAGSG